MNPTLCSTTPGAKLADGSLLLGEARELHHRRVRTEADLLAVVARFADAHPPTNEWDTVEWDSRFGKDGVPLTAPGIPQVSAAAIAELATTLGQRHGAGRSLVAHALQLRHRLPRAWSMLQAYELAPMVARRLAEHTFWCNEEAAAFVDAHVSAVAGQLTWGQVERLVTAAILQHNPEHPLHDKLAGHSDPRGMWFHHRTDGSGLTDVSGAVDVFDGLIADAVLDTGARELATQPGLADLGHQPRRAMAFGDLARRQPGLDFTLAETATTASHAGVPARTVVLGDDRDLHPVTRPTKAITLHVHLSEDALTGHSRVGRVENTQQPVTAERIREWLGDPAARITLRPIVNSGDQIHSDAYEIPDRLIRQIEITELTCVFPWCDKPATSCDKDHGVPYAAGGQTCSHNLAPLCRTHHILKTHTLWRYVRLDPDGRSHPPGRGAVFLWTSPYGYQYRRDRLGTTAADPPTKIPPA